MTWILFVAAILLEVAGTIFLRASDGLQDRRWLPAVAGAYLLCFALFSLALRRGLAVGVAYGVWAASGVALTALAGRLLFGDPLTGRMTAGIGLVAAGVLLVESGAHSA